MFKISITVSFIGEKDQKSQKGEKQKEEQKEEGKGFRFQEPCMDSPITPFFGREDKMFDTVDLDMNEKQSSLTTQEDSENTGLETPPELEPVFENTTFETLTSEPEQRNYGKCLSRYYNEYKNNLLPVVQRTDKPEKTADGKVYRFVYYKGRLHFWVNPTQKGVPRKGHYRLHNPNREKKE